ncbi:hypothetical protein KBY93_09640 [Synechococcus sp. J7-Johnson]|jgi:hypothetical protein|uniref:hypothetical protein n=1 Tax=unclassified Synechococcus TaxID=2626047 RepID=UPI000B985AA3|nr:MULTISPECIES: hypothetical protein [unclassified Synechococcus]MCP9819689.1 hypothetical protein [Synechococcus sp. Cruz-9H2]MCP9840897.1 hypothetical protein [Synechococcus sp. J7-Johnson]MCP9843994.1 hypothetical protein [Synechococcus sp. Edmonson 11F2]MCP9856119.1 hypothetical protein [Synechococcus sp. Cruz-9C9]MCP9863403.1 hypothetical protein [Synechococcus sp. Cruz-7E5]
MRTFVALTPLAGTLALPFLVPVLMVKVGIGTAVGMAVLVSTLWFVVMLRTAEMPGHH